MVAIDVFSVIYGDDITVVRRAKQFAGGLYVLLIISQIIMSAFLYAVGGRLTFSQRELLRNLQFALYIGVPVLVSAWYAYTSGGMSGWVLMSAAPGFAFLTIAVVVTLLQINAPDAPLWFFAIAFYAYGVLAVTFGFVLGVASRWFVSLV